MHVSIEKTAPTRVANASLKPRGRVHRSPAHWRDQVLYFLLPDRFSDGKEDTRPAFDRANPERYKADKAKWMASGKTFQGGTIKGITSKLGYIKRLGATAIWLGPIWQQRAELQTYHGYAIQNFLDVDSRFGTRQDLRDLVDEAHDKGLYVLLDVIYNHSGNNWFYLNSNGELCETMPYNSGTPYAFGKWRSKTGEGIDSITVKKDGAWPTEFQDVNCYTRAGQIGRWDPANDEEAKSDNAEFRRGDFFDLKDLDHSREEVLGALVRVYQYWIALTDCDGFRIDTVKHTTFEASRNFCGAIREYAESIGKENFLLLGEVTGGQKMICDYLEIFGRNIDAALDIGEPADRLADMVKGFVRPEVFFSEFTNQDAWGSHRLIGRYHVSILDDHDKVGCRNGKCRFSAGNETKDRYQQVAHAIGVQLTTLGIPCIYYGTEQAFDGSTAQHDANIEPLEDGNVPFGDRYIRECMFGGDFGAFETEGCHFFDESHPAYVRIAAITSIRKQKNLVGLALRRGRQYLREITRDLEEPFSLPAPGEIAAWSRIFFSQDVIVTLNTHGTDEQSAYISLDPRFHPEGSALQFLYRGDWKDEELENPAPNGSVPINYVQDRATIRIDLPPAGMAILA
jgi:glycosidase